MQGYIKTDIAGDYAIIEFFHHSHNSLHSKMLKELKEAIENLEKEENVKCILLKSGGNRTFCAGANFDEMKAISNLKEGRKFFSGFGSVILAMKNSSKLIVGRVQGKAVGGGVGIISACDIVFATKYASIRLSEMSIGIGPFVIAPAVERKIGLAAFSELTLNPKQWKKAEWSKDKGLFSDVFDSEELLDEHIKNYLQEICAYDKDAISENKKMFWHNTDNFEQLMSDRAEITGRLVLNLNI